MSQSFLHTAASALALATALSACATEAFEPAPEAAPVATERFGLVQIRANAGRTTGATEQRVRTDVHFVEYRGVAAEAVQVALDAWTPPITDGCVVHPTPPTAGRDASLDLLSAGSVGVSGNGGATRLTPRFLGGGPRLSGFAYGGEQGEAPFWAPGELFTVWASGDEVGPFATTVAAPERIQFVQVSDREVGSASELRVDPAEDLDFQLFTDAVEVYVSIRAVDAFAAERVECRFEAIDGVVFDAAELNETFGDADLEVTLRSISVAPLPATAELEGTAIAEVYDRLVVRRR